MLGPLRLAMRRVQKRTPASKRKAGQHRRTFFMRRVQRKEPNTMKCWTLYPAGGYLSSQGVTTQVLSAYAVLTAVFGMGTGGTPQLSSPTIEVNIFCKYAPSKLYRRRCHFFKLSPRHISTGPLNESLHLHSRPINLVVFEVSYQLSL